MVIPEAHSTDPALAGLYDDIFHPSAAGYRLIAQRLEPLVRRALAEAASGGRDRRPSLEQQPNPSAADHASIGSTGVVQP